MENTSLQFWFRLLTPDTDSQGRIICLVERDNTYHVETRLNGRFLSATPKEGVRFVDDLFHDENPFGYWDVIRVRQPVTPALLRWADSILGQPYDYLGALNSALGVPVRDPYRWFCSLVAREAAALAGIDGLEPLPDPSCLRRQLWAHGGLVTASPTGKFPVKGLALSEEDEAYLTGLVDAGKIYPRLAHRLIDACEASSLSHAT